MNKFIVKLAALLFFGVSILATSCQTNETTSIDYENAEKELFELTMRNGELVADESSENDGLLVKTLTVNGYTLYAWHGWGTQDITLALLAIINPDEILISRNVGAEESGTWFEADGPTTETLTPEERAQLTKEIFVKACEAILN